MKNNGVIDSFKPKETLCPDVWDDLTIKAEVREKLLKIANEFIESLDVDVFVDDIQLTGSLANYNWSNYSDFDLHLIVDFEQFGNKKELFKELFDSKKLNFNEKYDFKIKKHEVEVYVQDSIEKHESTGVYSLMDNEWIKEPPKNKMKLKTKSLKSKTQIWKRKIENLISQKEKLTLSDYEKKFKSLKDEMKEYRKKGLTKKGEMSDENLVFKYLRRTGLIKKLMDSMIDKKNKELSLEIFIQEQLSLFNREPNFIKDIRKAAANLYNSKFIISNKNFNADIEKMQRALELLGYDFPKFGVDGKFGPETKAVLNKFQTENSIKPTEFFDDVTTKKIIDNLLKLNLKDADLTKANYQMAKTSEKFTYVDLNEPDGYQQYKDICDKFIRSRNPQSPVTGDMLASSAKKYLSYGYVPPELACAQLAMEGGLNNDPESRPIKTKNPFNVGNTDIGKNKYFSSFAAGVDAYYKLMTRFYLPKGKSADDLLKNFANTGGYRYASNKDYERKLNSIISNIA